MIIRPGPVRQIVNNNISNTQNKNAEPQTPPIVDSGSSVRKSLKFASQEDKKVNQSKPSKKRQLPKTTLEILMEDD